MTLPINTEKYSYRFYKNLNEDVKLKTDEYGRWDIDFNYDDDDWVNVDGFDSVVNACIIAIMTRYKELNFMDLYSDFGCRIHELIKENKSKSVAYRIELFVTDVLENMRRVEKINWVTVTDHPHNNRYDYTVRFSVTCKIDGKYEHMKIKNKIVEGEFSL